MHPRKQAITAEARGLPPQNLTSNRAHALTCLPASETPALVPCSSPPGLAEAMPKGAGTLREPGHRSPGRLRGASDAGSHPHPVFSVAEKTKWEEHWLRVSSRGRAHSPRSPGVLSQARPAHQPTQGLLTYNGPGSHISPQDWGHPGRAPTEPGQCPGALGLDESQGQ